jgi:hypothetical protein
VPNHLSGRLLLAKASGRSKKTLSLGGSLDFIDRYTAPAYRALDDRRLEERSGLEDDEFADAASALNKLRPKLDARTHDYADALREYLRMIRSFVNERPSSANGVRRLVGEISVQGDRVDNEFKKLQNDASVVEELSR